MFHRQYALYTALSFLDCDLHLQDHQGRKAHNLIQQTNFADWKALQEIYVQYVFIPSPIIGCFTSQFTHLLGIVNDRMSKNTRSASKQINANDMCWEVSNIHQCFTHNHSEYHAQFHLDFQGLNGYKGLKGMTDLVLIQSRGWICFFIVYNW